MFRASNIRHYLNFMESKGFSLQDVLEGSRIDAEELKRPAYLVDLDQCQAVISNMIRLTENQGIGLEIGNHKELTDLGIVGHAMMSSKNARHSTELWIRYSNSLVGTPLAVTLNQNESALFALTITELRPMGFAFNFCVEEILAMVIKLGDALVFKPLMPSLLELSYPAPAHQEMYARYLRCVPSFNARATRIVFDGTLFDLPVRGSDEEFNAICLVHCNHLMRHIADQTPLAARIRALLLSKLDRLPTLIEIAHALNMSPRSLRRHLHAEGHSFKSVTNQFRIEIAKEYLTTSQMSAKETAHILGFQSTNAFRRAFKTYSGVSIPEFQAQTRAPSRSIIGFDNVRRRPH